MVVTEMFSVLNFVLKVAREVEYGTLYRGEGQTGRYMGGRYFGNLENNIRVEGLDQHALFTSE